MVDYADLPRDWMMVDFAILRAAEMKDCVSQTVQWGFDEPEGLTNNYKRAKWMRECHEKAWDILAFGDACPQPGKAQPQKVKEPMQKVSKPAQKKAVRSICKVSADEANEWLRNLPRIEPSV